MARIEHGDQPLHQLIGSVSALELELADAQRERKHAQTELDEARSQLAERVKADQDHRVDARRRIAELQREAEHWQAQVTRC